MKTLISILLIFFFHSAHSHVRQDWLSVYKITQEHPVYRSGEPIQRPGGTYQLLMVLHFIDGEGSTQRDCIWYRLPQDENLGVLKVIRNQKECRDWLESPVWEISDIRSLTFKRESQKLIFEYTTKEAQLKVEKFELLNLPDSQTFQAFQSSHQKRSIRGVFFLSPRSTAQSLSLKVAALRDQAECSFTDGSCQRCPQGVVKVWDADRPHYKCGIDHCGEKGELACLRGFEWKREREKPTCRLNPWHLYCQQGLRLECEGELGFCR